MQCKNRKRFGQLDSRIDVERKKTLQIIDDNITSTNNLPPNVGIMKVEEDEVIPPGSDGGDYPVSEDDIIDPQRPVVGDKKRSWWKRLFSSEEDG